MIYEHLPLPDPPNFSQIGIFGFKICHLATLVGSAGGRFCSKKEFNRNLIEI
jgi:hypothetical protein